MAANVQLYNSYGEKYEVPRGRVNSLGELQIGDHIAFHRMLGSYWHHCIVEYIHLETDRIDVIEYSNTAKEFLKENCSPLGKGFDLAKVTKGSYNFRNEDVYLFFHKHCLDRATVIQRARSRLGENQYSPFSNNCENFAMWCKTGKSSSDQVNKAEHMVGKELGTALENLFIEKSAKFVKTGVQVVSKKITNQAFKKVTSSVTTSITTKEVFTQSAKKTVSNSAILGVACGVVLEGISTLNDIRSAHEDMKQGNMTNEEYNKVVGKRVATGVGRFGGSSVGFVVGQLAIPIPFVGGLVGSVVGGLTGSFTGNAAAYATLALYQGISKISSG